MESGAHWITHIQFKGDMASNVNPVIITEKVKGSSWLNKLRSHTLAHSIVTSGDIEARTSPNGTTLHIKPGALGLLSLNYKFLNEGLYSLDIPHNINNLNQIDPVATIVQQMDTFFADPDNSDSNWWDAQASYAIGDFFRVKPNTVTGDNSVPVPGGSWVCVSPVPYDYSAADLSAINGIFDPNIRALALAGVRKAGVNYLPRWPEPKQVAHKTTDGKGRYFELIGILPREMVVCEDGQSSVFFIGGFPSSSLAP